jgi:hypothetical protein
MRLLRRLECLKYQLHYALSKHKTYICDECKQTHITASDQIILNEKLCIFVGGECGRKVITQAQERLRNGVIDRLAEMQKG